MKGEDELREELRRIAPDFPEKYSPNPPDGYFNTLPDEVIDKWKKETPERRTISIWRNIAGIAAVLTALLIGGFWLLNQSGDQEPEEISAVEAYQYIHENIDDFEDIIETENVAEELHEFEVPKEEIEEFLMEELNETDVEELF